MDFLSSAFAAFIGAFAAVYLKNLFEKNKHIIRVHEETHSQLDKAHVSIFKNCLNRYNGQIEFEPPDVNSVRSGLKDFFTSRYILYTGYYSSELQQNIDELRSLYNGIDDTLTRREAFETHYEDHAKLKSLLTEIKHMCEDEVSSRRKSLKRLWHKLNRTFTASLRS